MTRRLISLLLIILMVASAFTAVSMTAMPVAAATATTTTITASNTVPLVNQQVTFTVTLKAGTTPLSKPIHLWCTFNGERYERGTVNTVNGVYTFAGPFSAKGQVIYHADFAGDGTYAASSGTVTVNVGTATTTTTITASNKYPAVGQAVTFTVNLKAGTTGLSKPVKIWHYLNGVRYEDGTHNTVSGVYKFTQAFGSTGQRIYYAKFAGDSSYAASQGTVTVTVKYGTTLSLTRERPWEKAALGQGITLTGYLKDQNGKPLANTKILFYSRTSPFAPWGTGYAGYTDSNGRFTSYGQTNQPTVLYEQVRYAGDSTHWGASSVQVQLIWKDQPQLSLYVAGSNAVADHTIFSTYTGKTVNLYGYLKDQNFVPLDTLITFYWRNSGTEAWNIGPHVYTHGSGSGLYTNVFLSNQPTTIYYSAFYAGDSTHWPAASNSVRVTWYAP